MRPQVAALQCPPRFAFLKKKMLRVVFEMSNDKLYHAFDRTVWPSGLRRWLQAPVRKGVGSNPTAVTCIDFEIVRILSLTTPHVQTSK